MSSLVETFYPKDTNSQRSFDSSSGSLLALLRMTKYNTYWLLKHPLLNLIKRKGLFAVPGLPAPKKISQLQCDPKG